MRRTIAYQLTLGEAALAILKEVGSAVLASFYPHPYYHTFCSHAHRRSLYHALRRLERKHLVGVKRRSGRDEWMLTPEGEKLVRRITLKLEYAAQGHWDGKWRVVIFDVPERVRGRRDFLRRELSAFGFHQLQKSVWVTPYPLPDGFSELVGELALGKHFRILTVERIEADRDLRSIFFPTAV